MWIVGTADEDYLTGTDFDDVIFGLQSDDILIGGGGHDDLEGGAGADTMAGGTGNDTYYVDNAGDICFEFGSQGFDEVRATVTYTLAGALEYLTLTGSADIDGTGNTGNNTINGNSGDNFLYGNDGHDAIYGNGGDDVLFGEIGNDTLSGGVGADIMFGGTGNDTYSVDNAGDQCLEWGGDGVDWVYSSVSFTIADGIENLTLTGSAAISGTGNAGVNQISGNSAGNTLIGGAGDDWLLGQGGADSLQGGIGNDILNGGTLGDTMAGGADQDTYYVDHAGDIVSELADPGIDLVRTTISYTLGANVEWLELLDAGGSINGTGNGLDNGLFGNSFANTLNGGNGRDNLDGRGGADTMAGGAHDDTYTVDQAGDVVVEAAGAGLDTVNSSVDHTLAANVETLTLTGAAVSGTGNGGDNWIWGNAGANVLSGGLGSDSLVGGGAVDTLLGGQGDDHYYMTWFNDVPDADVVVEAAGEGIDEVHSGLVSTTLTDHVEKLDLKNGPTSVARDGFGNALDNTIEGNEFANTIDGLGGDDVMDGWYGDDTYYVDSLGDVVLEFNDTFGTADRVNVSVDGYTLSSGVDIGAVIVSGGLHLTGSGGANILFGNIGSDTLAGQGGDDQIDGNLGNDDIFGGLDDDALGGNVGLDALTGGTGNDTLAGGGDADRFLFFDGDGLDTITDFVAGDGSGDVIELYGYGIADFSGLSPLMSQAGGDVLISFDAMNQITLAGVTLSSLNAGDFVFG
jgi:Ca2+-binding RTX toxin-like protein